MRAQQKAVAQRFALLLGHHQRVLRVARRMAGRKIHALEVVVVGFNLRPHAHRIAQRGKDRHDLIQRARDGVLGPGQPPRSRQRDVDGLGLERGVARPAAQRRVEQALNHGFQGVEAQAQRLFRFGRRSLQPAAGNLVEPPLLAPQPLQPKRLHSRLAVERCGGLARLALQRGKRLVQRGLVKSRQIRYRFV